MKQSLILHIPHASDFIPVYDGYTVSKEELNSEILKLTDWYTDSLFFTESEIIVKANFSRIFCDVERFSDDNLEIMSRSGMGMMYEKSDTGKIIREVSNELRLRILNNFYNKHHELLLHSVIDQLQMYNRALILDCHSYPNIPFNRDLNQQTNRPDFNIGTDKFHTPDYLINFSISYFEELGYSVGVDWPYSGSIVPLDYYQKNQNVQSIMLEINRKLYMDEQSGLKSNNYLLTEKVVKAYIEKLRGFLN
jgi:N-formylglutamate deformylase